MTIIKGKVIHGKKKSRKLGFNTANIELNSGIILDGVYKINIRIKKNIYHGIGTYLVKNEIFEAHIFDFDKNLYGKIIEINIFNKIRNNKKFENIDMLKRQINIDIEKVKKINNIVITFGTFDILHPGHTNYLNNARFYGDKLITVIGTDNNVFKFKGKYPKNNSEKRIQNLKEINISNTIILGKENSPMKFINLYKPNIICLGYDQIGFSNLLENYIEKNNLKTKVIRLLPYKENIYKSSLLKNKS